MISNVFRSRHRRLSVAALILATTLAAAWALWRRAGQGHVAIVQGANGHIIEVIPIRGDPDDALETLQAGLPRGQRADCAFDTYRGELTLRNGYGAGAKVAAGLQTNTALLRHLRLHLTGDQRPWLKGACNRGSPTDMALGQAVLDLLFHMLAGTASASTWDADDPTLPPDWPEILESSRQSLQQEGFEPLPFQLLTTWQHE